jgi:hypothetical protein
MTRHELEDLNAELVELLASLRQRIAEKLDELDGDDDESDDDEVDDED